MSPVKINTITESTCKLYDKDANFIGEINSLLVLNDVRLQIKHQKLEGYYLVYDECPKIFIQIDSNGMLSHWPKGFFDTFETQLHELW